MTLGERVRQVRNSLPGKVTQTEFAEMLGISRGEIANIEGDVLKKPEGKMPLLLLICSTFGVRKEWLINGEEPMKLPAPDTGMEVIDRMLENDDDPVVRRVKRWMGGYFRLSPERRKLATAILDEIERLQDEQT